MCYTVYQILCGCEIRPGFWFIGGGDDKGVLSVLFMLKHVFDYKLL